MQPISNYGASYPPAYPQPSYPIYPDCFDMLTTHGIVAEDVKGYITDHPSPYLQNYVAQRGWAPTMPGQILPDPLPTLPNPQPLPKGNIYPSVYPQHPDKHTLVNKGKYDTAKKIALGVLLTGLTVLGIVKGKNLISKLRHRPAPSPSGTPWYKPITDGIKKGLTNIGNFFKNLWNKIFHRTPTP